ncbi:MAG: hypothetical protein ACI9JL_004266 [Paracoccaceae bacterium]|jgi:hypothetical protein
MLDRLAALAHLLRLFVEAALDGFQHMFMLLPGDPALLARREQMFDGAALAGIGPVTPQGQPLLLVGVAIDQPLVGGTDSIPRGSPRDRHARYRPNVDYRPRINSPAWNQWPTYRSLKKAAAVRIR